MPVQESFLIFEDIETTGLVPGKDEPIEIASLLTDLQMKEVARFHEKIKFDHLKMTPEAAAINHYDPKEWAFDAVPYYEYDHWLLKHIPYGHVATPVGSNPKYDREILWKKFYEPSNGFFKWGLRVIDVGAIAMALRIAGVIKVENVKLGTVAQAMGVATGVSHSAWDDMLAVKGIFEKFLEMVKPK